MAANGIAQGPANPFHDTQSTFAPEAQLGYFNHFGASSWLWGVKFKYEYVGHTSTERGIIVPQSGSFTPSGLVPFAGGTSLSGNVVIQSIQTRVDHELALLAFLGHSFGNSNVYLGGRSGAVWNENRHL